MEENLLDKLIRVLKIDDHYYTELYKAIYTNTMGHTEELAEQGEDVAFVQHHLRNTQSNFQTFFENNTLSAYILSKMLDEGLTAEEISSCLSMYDNPLYKKFTKTFSDAAYEYSNLILDTLDKSLQETEQLTETPTLQ